MTDHAYAPVPELNLLHAFSDPLAASFSQGFELDEFGATGGIDTWSSDPEFLDRFRSFGLANGSGSLYALWRVDDREDLAELPVVAFGDEGGVHLVASTLRDLLRLLACDRYVYVFPEGVSFSDPEEDAAEGAGSGEVHELYVAWLKREFGLGPAVDPDGVVLAAEERYGERFVGWMDRYVKGFAEEHAERSGQGG
ncbi:hypothetical protein RCO28_21135 [Streptomyces sp. LHD-70]|uniref:hypothetical protein n=1 Tax=Streptomyces sp. LHD-70 TaxID=3072140 RepID=UPI00280EAA12|nr:hypothetical protein [Streptomyces sp. LHD-70]MDQ8704977.1 hypothetical protein [Streptomyces sp. LHD-70]